MCVVCAYFSCRAFSLAARISSETAFGSNVSVRDDAIPHNTRPARHAVGKGGLVDTII
jgi:hypothetical protein